MKPKYLGNYSEAATGRSTGKMGMLTMWKLDTRGFTCFYWIPKWPIFKIWSFGVNPDPERLFRHILILNSVFVLKIQLTYCRNLEPRYLFVYASSKSKQTLNLGWRVTFTWKSATVKKQSQKFDLRIHLRGREHSHFSVGHTCRSVKSAYRLLIRLPTFQDLSRTFTLRHISTTNGVFRVILLDFILTQFGYGDGLEIVETPFGFGQSDEKVT